jgi:BirA family biotin operon repressor/biotin-[acetyl-CoA-carboxylase] ligase
MALYLDILKMLADGRFHSGTAIGDTLSVSRTAVWKALQQCESLGLELHSVRGRGYRLAKPLELLDEKRIRQHCSSVPVKISLFEEIDSTNRWLLEQDDVHAHVCLAERQTSGRGRRGREWLSPFAANIYLSLGWRFESGPAALGGLSLAVGVAVIRALQSLGISEAGLKWPNDILARGAKLGGILLELRGETEGPCEAIIGVGLNVAMPAGQQDRIDQQIIDVHAINNGISRNRLVGTLITELKTILDEFITHGFESLHAEWQALDVYRGKEVVLDTLRDKVRGMVRGVDSSGALLLECADGVRRFNAGEVSLRGG